MLKEGLGGDFGSSKLVSLIEGKTKKELLSNLKINKGKTTVYRALSEEMLRFALERTDVDIVLGMEGIHYKDHTHYPRGGLDQITSKIAAAKGKTIGFSFADILRSKDRGRLLGRMMLNIRLCKKYNVKMVFSSFASSKSEMRSTKDLEAFWRILSR